jgi:hypothetical protein
LLRPRLFDEKNRVSSSLAKAYGLARQVLAAGNIRASHDPYVGRFAVRCS